MGNNMGCGSSTDAQAADAAVNGGGKGGKKQKEQIEVEPIELTEAVVQQYVQLEKDINKLERKNVLKKYEAKMMYADEIKKTVDQLEATHKELKKQADKEKADVDNIEQPSVRAFLKQQGTWDQKFDKEKQEYLNALNQQEVADKELQGSRKQYDRASKIAEIYKRKSDKLNDMYDKQDRMLTGIFGGDYGSDLENTLESQLDTALEWQQRVSLAKFKWTNGRVLLVHACTQMAFGITRWKELESIDTSNTRMRYFAAAEARNNFIAAGQNVQSCRVYLGKVKFPYCTEDEMAQLESTVNAAFADIQSNSSFNKALEVYQSVHKKVAALIQWFDQVINETILKDLEKANTEVSKVQKELRTERLRLINDRVREKLGHDITIEYDDVVEDDDDEELLALEAESVNDDGDLPGQRQNLLGMSKPDRQPTPMSKKDLAPLASKDSLYGDVAKKMDEYELQKQEMANRNEAVKVKQDMFIQEQIEKRKAQGGGGPPKSSKGRDKSAKLGAKPPKSSRRRSRRERRQSMNPAAFAADAPVPDTK